LFFFNYNFDFKSAENWQGRVVVRCVMHKCIIVKLGERKQVKYIKTRNFLKSGEF